MSQTSSVVVSREGAVGIIELARPEKFNCLSLTVHAGIEEAMDAFEQADSGVRAILIRAQGKHFCTGADLDEVKALRAGQGRALESAMTPDTPKPAARPRLSNRTIQSVRRFSAVSRSKLSSLMPAPSRQERQFADRFPGPAALGYRNGHRASAARTM